MIRADHHQSGIGFDSQNDSINFSWQNSLRASSPYETNAISQFNIVQHCWMQHVELVWPPCYMVLYDWTRCMSSLRQGQRQQNHHSSQTVDLYNSDAHRTCCIRLAMQYNNLKQSWMLHSFGQGLRINLNLNLKAFKPFLNAFLKAKLLIYLLFYS